jgi:diguanylate cyclase (GGDEF)-like protein/PAS domain S-box-containing protein
MISDVTAQRRVEYALQEREQYQRALLDNFPFLVWLKDAESHFLAVNQPLAAQFGWPSAESLVGKTDFDIAAPDLAEAYRADDRAVLESGRSKMVEEWIEDHGERRWNETFKSPVTLDGRVIGTVGFARDITARKKMEEELREQKEFFHLIAENIGDFIAVLDLEGRRLYNSPSYSRFFGMPRDLSGTDSFADIHPDDRDRVIQAFRETVRTGIGRQLDYRLNLADGTCRDIESTGSVIKAESGRVLRVVVVSRDITERKTGEQQMQHFAFYDSLTRLPNRRLLIDRMEQSMLASARSRCYGAVMFLDLDAFKPLNDVHGHSAGDALLVVAAERMKACVREVDTVSRFGGDEFVVVINQMDPDKEAAKAQALLVAEKIHATLSEPYHLPVRHPGKADELIEYGCTATIGVVLFLNHDASQDDILKRADEAMYLAKKAGRNRVHFYDQPS